MHRLPHLTSLLFDTYHEYNQDSLLSSNISLILVNFPFFSSYLESANWKNSKLLNSLVPIFPCKSFVANPSPEMVTFEGSSGSISIT